MRYLIAAVVLVLVAAAGPAHARGAGQFSGAPIVPPMTGTTVPPFNGPIVPPFTGGTRMGTRSSSPDFGGLGYGYSEAPAVENDAAPGADFIEPGPAPSKTPAELPPCHEMTPVGLVIERGIGCSSGR
jgi:hypothetical protein